MNTILLAIIFTVAVLVDFFWESIPKNSSTERLSRLKMAIGAILLILGWWQAVLQFRRDAESDADTKFLKAQLSAATLLLTNSSQVTLSMQKEQQRLQKQSDADLFAQFESLLRVLIREEDQVYFFVGNLALKTGRDRDAERYFREAIRKNRLHSNAHNNLGLILQARGDLAEAGVHFDQAYKANTNNGAAAGNYVLWLAKENRLLDEVGLLTSIQNVHELTEMPEELLIRLAEFLAQFDGVPHFWRYLDEYVKRADSPDLARIAPMLKARWNALSVQQKVATTNWSQRIKADQQKEFKEVLASHP